MVATLRARDVINKAIDASANKLASEENIVGDAPGSHCKWNW